MTPELWARWRKPSQDEVMDSCRQGHIVRQAAGVLAGYSPVLCVGCGDGTEIREFKRATGVTLNATGLEGRRDIIVADMHTLPFKSESFDAVFCKDCFEHALAPSIALSELCRVARRVVLLVTPDEYWEHSPHHPLIPTVRQIAVIANKLGWETRVADMNCFVTPESKTVEYKLHMCLLTRKP